MSTEVSVANNFIISISFLVRKINPTQQLTKKFDPFVRFHKATTANAVKNKFRKPISSFPSCSGTLGGCRKTPSESSRRYLTCKQFLILFSFALKSVPFPCHTLKRLVGLKRFPVGLTRNLSYCYWLVHAQYMTAVSTVLTYGAVKA